MRIPPVAIMMQFCPVESSHGTGNGDCQILPYVWFHVSLLNANRIPRLWGQWSYCPEAIYLGNMKIHHSGWSQIQTTSTSKPVRLLSLMQIGEAVSSIGQTDSVMLAEKQSDPFMELYPTKRCLIVKIIEIRKNLFGGFYQVWNFQMICPTCHWKYVDTIGRIIWKCTLNLLLLPIVELAQLWNICDLSGTQKWHKSRIWTTCAPPTDPRGHAEWCSDMPLKDH